jgi:F-type H+-transporting ATPase subunit delta
MAADEQGIARRYARGLMLSIESGDLLKDVELEFKEFAQNFVGKSELVRLFENPSFSPSERIKVIDHLASIKKLTPVFHTFLKYLVKKDRITLTPIIYEEFLMAYDEKVGRLRAKIFSATPIDEKTINAIKSSIFDFEQKEILIEPVIKKDLIGGIRIEVGGKVFDGSVKARFEGLRSQLMNGVGLFPNHKPEQHHHQHLKQNQFQLPSYGNRSP